ncbi:MAG: DUF3842 family protein [Eubacteriales bacterium]|nr:DUF3842 family protein [Eubacteriales bacterium]
MQILVVDAQGGGIGKQLVSMLKKNRPDCEITAVGTNSIATSAMLKAGADHCATGENAVITGCRKADYIIGPVGIVIADSMYGEITPAMAVAIGQSSASRILLPINHCSNIIAGVQNLNTGALIKNVLEELDKLEKNN